MFAAVKPTHLWFEITVSDLFVARMNSVRMLFGISNLRAIFKQDVT